MPDSFLHTTLGHMGWPICRLGLSASYRPGKKTIYKALDEGINYFFCFGIDSHMIGTLRGTMKGNRDKYIISTGAYNLIWGHPNIRRTLEKRLRQLRTDYIDVFNFLGVTRAKQFTASVKEELYRLREEGKVRAIGISTHDRGFAGQLAAEGVLDVLMVRYNAAHRGAEKDIFPYLNPHNPGIVSFTATRWRYLLRRPRRWPKDSPIPTPGLCYRFVLSNPHVHICLTAPSNIKQFEENIAALREGPLSPDEMDFMQRFGDTVHHTKKWFM